MGKEKKESAMLCAVTGHEVTNPFYPKCKHNKYVHECRNMWIQRLSFTCCTEEPDVDGALHFMI